MSTIDLLRREPRARVFFAVLVQSALGTGAGYVALLLVAYDRFHSPWAISLVLIADLLPPMVLGPLFGAVADRWSRRTCAIVADLVRAIAFLGIGLFDGFAATLALALLAGAGTALFTPATLAALPSLVDRKRLPAATSIYGAITDLGMTAGPGVGALVLTIAGAETILVANAATFALSAIILVSLRFGEVPAEESAEATSGSRSLFGETRYGLREIGKRPGLWLLLGASGAALFFVGLVNVSELPFITETLDGSEAVFSAVAAITGLGIMLGSLAGAGGGNPKTLRRRYLQGLSLTAVGFILSGLAPRVEFVFATFMLAGFGNGFMLVHERLIIQGAVPDKVTARVFGVKDALTAWAFAVAFLIGGGMVSVLDARPVLLIAGAGGLLIAGAVAIRLPLIRLRGAGPDEARESAVAASADRLGGWSVGQHQPDVVDR